MLGFADYLVIEQCPMQTERIAIEDWSAPNSTEQSVRCVGASAVECIFHQFHIASIDEDRGELVVSCPGIG